MRPRKARYTEGKRKNHHHTRRAATGAVQKKTAQTTSRTECAQKHTHAEESGRHQTSPRPDAEPQKQAERITTSATAATTTTKNTTHIRSKAKQRDKRTGTRTRTCKRLQQIQTDRDEEKLRKECWARDDRDNLGCGPGVDAGDLLTLTVDSCRSRSVFENSGRCFGSRSPACPGCRRPTVRTPTPSRRPKHPGVENGFKTP